MGSFKDMIIEVEGEQRLKDIAEMEKNTLKAKRQIQKEDSFYNFIGSTFLFILFVGMCLLNPLFPLIFLFNRPEKSCP